MGRIEFVQLLRATAAALTPLTESGTSGAAIWDGQHDVEQGAKRSLEPYALAWWSTLIAIAELLEAQESPISGRQLDYLRRTLFGGMGSLNDLYFDSKAFGGPADFVNSSLEPRRRELYESFKTL